jgi:hypothetical protein
VRIGPNGSSKDAAGNCSPRTRHAVAKVEKNSESVEDRLAMMEEERDGARGCSDGDHQLREVKARMVLERCAQPENRCERSSKWGNLRKNHRGGDGMRKTTHETIAGADYEVQFIAKKSSRGQHTTCAAHGERHLMTLDQESTAQKKKQR